MIAGFSGELVSQAYAEQELLPSTPTDNLHVFERQLLRWWRGVSRTLGPASSARAVLDIGLGPLLSLLGHSRPVMSPHPQGLSGKLEGSGIGVLALPWSVPIRTAYRGTRQVGLAASAEWAIACNGQALEIVDCTRPWVRARVEFDFDHLLATSKGITMLWLLANAAAALRTHVAASDAHTSRVCGALGDGVLEALPRLAAALAPHRPRHSLDQALTLIYRILFLLFAEARGMVPIGTSCIAMPTASRCSPVRRGDPTRAACGRRCRRSHGWRTPDARPPISRSRRSTGACSRRGMRPSSSSAAASTRTSSVKCCWRWPPSQHARDAGAFRITTSASNNLGRSTNACSRHEESTASRPAASILHARSPSSWCGRRSRRWLKGKSADDILSLRVLDPAMGSGAFLVAACRYLADRCEIADVNDGRWVAGDVTAADRSTLRRLVAERCCTASTRIRQRSSSRACRCG